MAPQSMSPAVDDEDPDKSPISGSHAKAEPEGRKGSSIVSADLAGSSGESSTQSTRKRPKSN